MAIFNSYVKLPKGNIIVVWFMMSHHVITIICYEIMIYNDICFTLVSCSPILRDSRLVPQKHGRNPHHCEVLERVAPPNSGSPRASRNATFANPPSGVTFDHLETPYS